MCKFHLILLLSLGVLWIDTSGSVIRNSRSINYGADFPENFKDAEVKNLNKLADIIFRNDTKSVESIPVLETGKQLQVTVDDDLNRKHVRKRETSNRIDNNKNYSNKNQSLSRTLQANGNLINVRITDKEVHADLISNQSLPPFVDSRLKENLSNYKTVGGKANNAPNPWCSISINLLVGNNITIQKFLLHPSENNSIERPLELYNTNNVIKDKIDLSATKGSPRIPKMIDVNKLTGKFSKGKNTFEGIISKIDENINVLNDSTPLNTSIPGPQSTITKNIGERFPTTDVYLTSDNSFSSSDKHNPSTISMFNLEPSHYDDVDPSGIEIGWPITFFPPENCSDATTIPYNNTNSNSNSNSYTNTNSDTKNSTVNYDKHISGSITTSKVPYYDDVDPSGIEIGSPITFFPPENCNETIVTNACVGTNVINSAENQ